MDIKTAIELLKRDSEIISDRIIGTTDARFVSYRVNRLKVKQENDIADFIEQQEKEIIKLCKSLNYIKGIVERGENRIIADNEIIEKITLDYVIKLEQQEKYAELGRLIADREESINICPISSFNKNCKESCLDYCICKLRTELAEVQK